jgi:hypothetical protein
MAKYNTYPRLKFLLIQKSKKRDGSPTKERSLKMGMAANTLEVVNRGKKERWKKVKLKEVMSNPKFLGKTVRLGDTIFEVKGVMHE